MANISEITKINAIKELEPAFYEVAVTYADGSSDTIRMSILHLNALKLRLGLPIEV